MFDRIYLLLLLLYRQLPVHLRRWIVRAISPSYTVGSICFVENDRGELLLVRLVYRNRWGVPGGLLVRGETPEDAVRREAREELGIDIELFEESAVVIDPAPQRIDVAFRAVLADPSAEVDIRPQSPEIVEARWFPADDLPELQLETAQALVALQRRTVASVMSD